MNVEKQDYIFIDVEWQSGFKHIVPCRGYNLQSQLEFNKSLTYVKDFKWRVVTEKQYNAHMWPSIEENEDERTSGKRQTLKKNPAKGKPRKATDKDSKVIRNASGRGTSTSKKKRTELREPEVRDVRKPKKNVARTNNPGTKTLSRTRNSKRSSQ